MIKATPKTHKHVGRHQMALLIPAHNEELVIEATLKSAIKQGQAGRDIYVVDDNSTDRTRELAAAIIGEKRVLSVERSGKALALKKAVAYFNLTDRYAWIHMADADGIFGKDYFKLFRAKLSDRYVAALGFVQSMEGGWISKFRVYEYTYGQIIMRRLQKVLGTISVIPGPTACFRSDIFSKLDFETDCLTEDFDITLQIHRQKLGKIAYIPEAKAYTQDPQNFHDYCVQLARWYRGFFQAISKNKVGLRAQKIDLYLGFLMFEMFLYYAELLFILPILFILHRATGYTLAALILTDVLTFFAINVIVAIAAKRRDILAAFPLFYLLRLAQMGIFLKAFVEVMILRRFRVNQVGWETSSRRYRVATKG